MYKFQIAFNIIVQSIEVGVNVGPQKRMSLQFGYYRVFWDSLLMPAGEKYCSDFFVGETESGVECTATYIEFDQHHRQQFGPSLSLSR